MAKDIYTRPSGTSWGAVLGGWLATVGVAALLTGPVALLQAFGYRNEQDLSYAVPVLVALAAAYLVGGHVAGRMAGYRTSWHGLLSATWSLFAVLVVMVLGIAANRGMFGANVAMPELLPGVQTVSLYHSPEVLAFGGSIGFLAAIFAGWLGGLLAPERYAALVTTAPAPVVGGTPVAATVGAGGRSRVVVRREGFHLLPQPGRKGGERVETIERTDKEQR